MTARMLGCNQKIVLSEIAWFRQLCSSQSGTMIPGIHRD